MPAPEDPEDEAAIRERALKLLARREHAPAELEQKLASRGYATSAIRRVLAALAEADLLSERRYAEAVVRSRAQRGQGPNRIRAELSARGVEEATIDAVLVEADQDWHRLAVEVCRKRFGQQPPANFPDKAKRMRFLQRRGFAQDQISAAVADSD